MKERIVIGLSIGFVYLIPILFFDKQLEKMIGGLSLTWTYSIEITLFIIAMTFAILGDGRGLLLKGKIIFILYLSGWLGASLVLIEICEHLFEYKQLFYKVTTRHLSLLIVGVLNVGIFLPVYMPFVLKKIPAKFKN